VKAHRINPFLIAIFVMALLLRAISVTLPRQPEVKDDAIEYDRIGLNIISGNGFSMDEHPPYMPTARRGPIYPAFLALVYSAFGHSHGAVRAIQALIGAVTCVLVFFIGRMAFNEKVGLISASLSAFYPPMVDWCRYILTETLFTFLIASAVLFLMIAFSSSQAWHLASAFLFGTAALCRPIAVLLPFLVPLLLLIVYRNRRRAVTHSLAFISVAALTLTPWTVRNYMTFHRLIPITTGGGLTLFGGSLAGRYDDRGEIKAELERAIGRRLLNPSSITVEEDARLIKKGLINIRETPLGYLKACIRRSFRLWRIYTHSQAFGLELTASEYLRNRNYPAVLAKLILAIISCAPLPLAIIGVSLNRRKWRDFLPLILIMAYFTALYSLIHAIERYNAPMLPYLLIFAASGAWGVRRWLIRAPHMKVDYRNYEARLSTRFDRRLFKRASHRARFLRVKADKTTRAEDHEAHHSDPML